MNAKRTKKNCKSSKKKREARPVVQIRQDYITEKPSSGMHQCDCSVDILYTPTYSGKTVDLSVS